MSEVLAVLLAAAAAACLAGVPRTAALRLVDAVLPAHRDVTPRRPGDARRVGRGSPVAPDRVLRRRSLRQLPLPVVALAVVAVAVVAVAGAGGLVGTHVLVPSALLVAGVLVLLRVRGHRRAAAARESERAQTVEACAALAAELRAGRTPAEALCAAAAVGAGPSARALASAASALRLGGDVAAALGPPPGTAVPGTLRALAACWTVCAGSGAGLAAAVERLEEGLRAEQAERRAVEAELAGPRATAALLAVLPAGGLLLAAGLGADPLAVLLTTPLGLVCLALGLALDATGVWWTGRLVAAAGGRS